MKHFLFLFLFFASSRALAQDFCPRVFKVKDTLYTDPARYYQWYKNGLALPADTNRWTLPKDPTATYTVVAGDLVTYKDALKSTKPIFGIIEEEVVPEVANDPKALPLDGYKQIAKRARCMAKILLENTENSFPTEISNFTALTDLAFSVDKLAKLPPEIGKLKSLSTLDIGGYSENLTSLPPEIGQLQGLVSLELSLLSGITSLPPEIGQLKMLRALDISVCGNLKGLPPEIGKLQALETLHLKQCEGIPSLPPEIGKLAALKTLSIDECSGIKSLPPEIGKLQALETLDLMLCPSIRSLPPEIGKLAGTLKELNLYGVPIPKEKRAYYQKLLPNTKIFWE